MSDESTIEQLSDREEILKAIADLGKSLNARIDNLEKNTDAQLEAIREGIVHNDVRFDRQESEFYKVRSDISSLRADIKELAEEVRQNRKVKISGNELVLGD